MKQIEEATATALYNRLLAPVKQTDGSTVYTISTELARQIRNEIGEKQDD